MKTRRMLAVLVMLASCSGAGQSTSTTTTPRLAPTTTAVPSTTTTRARVVLPGFVEGTLPDGTDYRVTGLPLGGEDVQTVQAPIMTDQGALGIASMIRSEEPFQESYWESVTRLVIPTEGWTIEVSIDPDVIEELGPDAAAQILSGVRAHTSLLGMPVLDLAYPFRIGNDEEAASPLLVGYETFEVRRGCTFQLDSECESGLQAVPFHEKEGGSDELGVERVWGDRFPLVGDPFDPGPLEPRINHAVVWTGTELTVFGGTSGGESGPVLNDGAAFDPLTGTWRLLSPSPLPLGAANLLASWTGAELIVAGPPGGGNAAAYDPADDRWRLIADPPFSPHQDMAHAWRVKDLVIWSPADDQVVSYDPIEDHWTPLSATGLDAESGALYWIGDHLYAVGANFNQGGPCEGMMLAVLEGDGWRRLPNGEMGTGFVRSCGNAHLTAVIGNRVYVVDGGSGERFRAFDTTTGAWIDLPSPPIPGCEGFPSPAVMGEALLVHNYCGHEAIYDPDANVWREVSLPDTFAEETAWTGTELLSWGYGLCCGLEPPLAWRVSP